jgi:hypothetical protein
MSNESQALSDNYFRLILENPARITFVKGSDKGKPYGSLTVIILSEDGSTLVMQNLLSPLQRSLILDAVERLLGVYYQQK